MAIRKITEAGALAIAWRRVPGGGFMMGSGEGEGWYDEGPQHEVFVGAFEISAFPVTNEQYAAFIAATGAEKPSTWLEGTLVAEVADHPVSGINWHEARAFARWVGERLGTAVVLPTEAEWEKAARGVDGRRYPWGDIWYPHNCNSWEGGMKGTTAVNRYPHGRSPYDVFDMVGNVWEWTASVYGRYPLARDGRETDDSDRRTLRGGAWPYGRDFCQTTSRMIGHVDNRNSLAGFRLVRRPA